MCCRRAASCAPAARSLPSSSKPRAMPDTRTRRHKAMNVETPRIRTAAETGLADVFASAKARLPGGRDVARRRGGGVPPRREGASRRCEAAGLPHRRIEAWKYTDLRALMRDAKPLAGAPRAEKQALADILPGIEAHRIAIVNGA